MNAQQLSALIQRAMVVLEASREELRALDAAIGDGDLGITVGDGAFAVRGALSKAGVEVTLAGVLRLCAQSFTAANPSTMSALTAAGLLAGAKTLDASDSVDRTSTLRWVGAAAEAIQSRGGARVGDKTMLDALVPSVEALRTTEGDGRDVLEKMIDAAQDGVRQTMQLQSQCGRAAWVGERSVGHADGGATAYVRLLEALLASWVDSPE